MGLKSNYRRKKQFGPKLKQNNVKSILFGNKLVIAINNWLVA